MRSPGPLAEVVDLARQGLGDGVLAGVWNEVLEEPLVARGGWRGRLPMEQRQGRSRAWGSRTCCWNGSSLTRARGAMALVKDRGTNGVAACS